MQRIKFKKCRFENTFYSRFYFLACITIDNSCLRSFGCSVASFRRIQRPTTAVGGVLKKPKSSSCAFEIPAPRSRGNYTREQRSSVSRTFSPTGRLSSAPALLENVQRRVYSVPHDPFLCRRQLYGSYVAPMINSRIVVSHSFRRIRRVIGVRFI